MSTVTAEHRPTAHSTIRRLVARHPATAFLVMAFGFGWTSLIPILLSENGFGVLPIELPLTVVQSLVTIVGLAVPAFLVTAATGGKEGVRDLLGRLLRWRVGVRWYLVAIFGLPVAMLLAAIPFLGAAPLEALARKWPLLFALFLPEVLFPFVFIQVFEEAGWTGFMQDTLQERRGPLVASILVAPAFFLMHLPVLLMDAGAGLALLIVFGALVIMMTFFRIVVMWLYNGSGRSVLVVALFHSAYNSATSLGEQRFTGELIPGSAQLLIAFGVLVVVAVILAVFTGGRLAHEPAARPAILSTGTRQEGGAA